jgi:hypothetical protein
MHKTQNITLRVKIYTILFLLLTAGLSAQEKKAAIGIGPEWNMNSRDNFAGGAALNFDYALPYSFALGFTFTASNNLSGFTVMEPAAVIRRYFLGDGRSGLFAQADLGCYLFLEDGEMTKMFAGGLRGGYRIPIKSSFYIEPYGRVGYPFAFGVGAVIGIRFVDD